jgi:type II secretory pathway component PulK
MRRRSIESQRGVALLMALIAVFLLVIITFEVEQTLRVEQFITSNFEVDTKLDLACYGGLEVALARLREDRQQTEIDSLYDSWYKLIVHQELIEADVAGEEFLYLEDRERPRGGSRVDDQQTTLLIKIFDESAKFNVYRLVSDDQDELKKAKESFANVLDRFRADDQSDLAYNAGQQIGDVVASFLKRSAEQPFRSETPNPPVKKLGTLTCLHELLYTQAITPAMLWDRLDERGERVIPGLFRFITIWSDMQINVNSAEPAALAGLFSSTDAYLADRIAEFRDEFAEQAEREKDDVSKTGTFDDDKDKQKKDPTGGAPFEQTNDLKEKVEGITQDVYNEMSKYATVQSSVFSVFVTAKRGLQRRTKMWVVRRTEQGPRILFSSPVTFPYFLGAEEVEEAQSAALEESNALR